MLDKFHGVLYLTHNCQLDCDGCLIKKEDKSLSIDDLEQIKDYGPGKVNFLGGEPLLYKNLEEAFDIFSSIPITVQTNGLLVPEKLDLLKNARMVIVSVEGTEETTSRIRGDTVFKRAIYAVKKLKEDGINVVLRASVWRENLREIPDLIKLAKDLDVGVFVFPRLGEIPLSVREQIWLFQQFREIEFGWVDLPHYFCVLGEGGMCAAGEKRLAFTADGRIVPCQFQTDYLLGYIGDSLDLTKSNSQTYMKQKVVPDKCVGCEWDTMCKGSCPLTGWHATCPLRTEISRVLPSSDMGFAPTGRGAIIKQRLKGVVTC